ncbi:hypothetical protein OJAV_G00231590 [Oryzias javanicus]|uniref:SSD domain-containing protein n=1 Tax=Oryzias javanicus TaxID=123683 RepID=A0A3S2MCC5_ORYJA|nr:hypothetical protein OJAV_G00231590 [Oryzias javanicus]
MYQFYREVDAWIKEELRSAPVGLSNGWFISNLEFYDLQDSLSDGTLVAMALSVAVAFSVMLLTTWNIIISLYAILSIAGTIFVTVGSLVLLGWELNVLESVTISVAVGLSVDFSVHYGVAYRLAPEPDREGKVIFSLSRMGSAIAMAAVTTFVAGAMMMPSTVLAYTQLGTFMMLIMCISWAFATFFFQCMCRCLGPQGSCGQIPLPKKLQCPAFSEVTSTAPPTQEKSFGLGKYQIDSRSKEVEQYELEPLAFAQKAEDKPQEELELGTRLYNGVPPHHTAPFPHAHHRSSETGRCGQENGHQVGPPFRCKYSQNMNCSCADPSHLLQQWTPCSCAPQDPLSCSGAPHLLPVTLNGPSKQNPTLLPSNRDPVLAHMECHVHYVHCPYTHLHNCSQGRLLTPKQGPAQACQLRKFCIQSPKLQATSAREQRSITSAAGKDASSGPVSETSKENDNSGSCQNMPAKGVRQAQKECLVSQETCQEKHRADDDCHAENPASPTQTDADCNQGTQERRVGKRSKQISTGESPASTKKISCFNRTLKVKSSSASEAHVPKNEASMPPPAVVPSPESIC